MRWFRLVVVGHAVSTFGSYLNMVALNLYVYHLTGSPLAVGLFLAVRLLSSVVSGPVSGALASRFDRKRLMMTADLAQGGTLALLLLAPGDHARVAALYGFALIAGFCSTLSQVSLRSSIPEIVGAEHRARANGLLVTGRSLAMIAGFSSAGVLTARFGYTTAFLVDAVSFAVSALILFPLPLRTRAARDTAAGEEDDREAGQAEGGGPRALLLMLRAMPLIAVMVLIRSVDGLGSSSHNVALPVYSTALDPDHPAAFVGRFWAVWAVGNIVTQQACGWYARRSGRTPGERAFALGACVMSAAFIVVFTGLPSAGAVLVALLAGMADGFTEIAYVTRLQTVGDRWRGRVFGVSAMAENTGFGLGMLICAGLMERFSPLQVVAVFHGAAIALCLALLVRLTLRPPGRAAGTPDGPGPAASATGAPASAPASEGTRS